jgi:hypothetical protein
MLAQWPRRTPQPSELKSTRRLVLGEGDCPVKRGGGAGSQTVLMVPLARTACLRFKKLGCFHFSFLASPATHPLYPKFLTRL